MPCLVHFLYGAVGLCRWECSDCRADQVQWESNLILNWPKYKNWTKHALCFGLCTRFSVDVSWYNEPPDTVPQKCKVLWRFRQANKQSKGKVDAIDKMFWNFYSYVVKYLVWLHVLKAWVIFMISSKGLFTLSVIVFLNNKQTCVQLL